jgi:transcriptional regulator NrdR family protein
VRKWWKRRIVRWWWKRIVNVIIQEDKKDVMREEEDSEEVIGEEIIREVMEMDDSITLVRQAWIYKSWRKLWGKFGKKRER